MRIVRACMRHLQQIHAIEQRSFPTPWSYQSLEQDILHHSIALYLVAEEKREVLGYVGAWRFLGEAHITTIAVHPDSRNRGIARKLLEVLLDRLRKEGVSRITLEVRESNLPARNLYAGLGFVQEGIRKGYYADTGEDALLLWKDM